MKWRNSVKNFSLLILFSLLSLSVLAQPPFSDIQSSNNLANELTIVSPLNFYYPQNNNISLNFDVLYSNSTKLTNSNTNCTILIYDNKGNLEIYTNLTYDANNNYWNGYYVTTNLGVYSVYVHCINSNLQNGYSIGSFEVTATGTENPTLGSSNQIIYLLIVSFILAIVFFILALRYQDFTMGYSSGFLFSVVGIYLIRNGFATINNIIIDSLGTIIVGVGCYILFRTAIEHLEEADR